MTTPAGLLAALAERAREQGEQTAFLYLFDAGQTEVRVTYRELAAEAATIATSLRALGVAGESVLLAYPFGPRFLPALLGTWWAGAVAVPAGLPPPAAPPATAATLSPFAALVRPRQPAHVLTTAVMTAALAPLLADAGLDGEVLASDRFDAARADTGLALPTPEAPALCLLASGKTSAAPGVIFTHAQLAALLANARQLCRATPQSVTLGCSPPHDYPGLLSFYLQPLMQGVPGILMALSDVLASPARWLQASSRHRASIVGAPGATYSAAAKALRAMGDGEVDLGAIATALVIGDGLEAVPLAAFADAAEPFGFRPEAFVVTYGFAEAGGDVTAAAGVPRRVAHSSREVASSGRPCPGVEVVVVDPARRAPLKDGVEGEIWVRSATLLTPVSSTAPKVPATEQQASLAGGAGPYLRTGDIGFSAQGELFVTGRLEDVLALPGARLNARDLEAVVARAHPALAAGAGVALAVPVDGKEQLTIVCERGAGDQGGGPNDASARVRAAVSAAFHLSPQAVLMVAPRSLPRNGRGEIDRAACRAALLANSLAVVEEWRRGDGSAESIITRLGPQVTADVAAVAAAGPAARRAVLERYLGTIVSELTGTPAAAVARDRDLTELGVDSFTQYRLAVVVHRLLGLRLSPTELLDHRTIEELAALLAAAMPSGVPTPVDGAVRWTMGVARSADELAAVSRFLSGLPAAEIAVLDAVIDGSRDVPYDAAALRELVTAGDLMLVTLHAGSGGSGPDGLCISERRRGMPYVDAQGVHQHEDAWEASLVVNPAYRKRFDIADVIRLMIADPRVGEALAGKGFLATLSLRTNAWRAHIEALVSAMAVAPYQRRRLAEELWDDTDAANLAFAAFCQTDQVGRVVTAIAAQSYCGVAGRELLARTGESMEALQPLLRAIVDEQRWPLLKMFVDLVSDGRATFVGYFLRWMEPLFHVHPAAPSA